MEKSEQIIAPAPKPHRILASSTAQWVSAAGFGIASAYAAAVAKIRSEFSEDVLGTPEVKAVYKDVGERIKALWAKAPEMKRSDYFKQLIDLKKEMFDRFNAVVETHHYRSGGWKGITLGILDRSKSMSHNSRRDVTVSAAVTGIVAFGGAMMFFKNREMSANNREMKHTLELMNARQEAALQSNNQDTPRR